MTRPGNTVRGDEADGWGGPWFSFWLNHTSYTPVEFAYPDAAFPEGRHNFSSPFSQFSQHVNFESQILTERDSTSGTRLVTVVQVSYMIEDYLFLLVLILREPEVTEFYPYLPLSIAVIFQISYICYRVTVNKNEELMLIACLCRRPNLERASRLNSDR
jgi:hypothetical protein